MTFIRQSIMPYFRQVNWMLLLYLALVMDVKMLVKIAALFLFIFLNRSLFKDKTIFRLKSVWFYASMISIALLNYVWLSHSAPADYFYAVAVGISFWAACVLSTLIIAHYVRTTPIEILENSISLFFLLNAFVTLLQLAWVMIDSGSINPYTYQGMHQKYFISTGDRMTGLTFDISTTNALINSFAVLYFLDKNKMHWAMLCMAVLLLTASNITFFLLLAVLLCYFIKGSTRDQKSMIVVCLLLMVLFFSKISPQNTSYITNAYKKIAGIPANAVPAPAINLQLLEKPDSILTVEERKTKTALHYLDSVQQKLLAEHPPVPAASPVAAASHSKPELPVANIHTEPYQRKRDTTQLQKELLSFASRNIPEIDTVIHTSSTNGMPGKVIALQQTLSYFKLHPARALIGLGIGNFSSKLSFRIAGVETYGGYPQQYHYINDDFRHNHLELYLNYFIRDIEIHSLINSPNNTYDQLLSEYGIVGLCSFFFFFVYGYHRKIIAASIGFPMLLLMLGAFATDYWFEQLSVVILFELLVLIIHKRGAVTHE